MARAKRLPGMEEPVIDEIDEAATIYSRAMAKRQKLNQEEKDAKDNLLQLMLKHDVRVYKWAKKIISVTAKEKVTISEAAEPVEEDDDDPAEE